MTSEGEHFDTAVREISGVWPGAPERWSYSSLREAEECPRRWMLGRATYPGVWERSGYPSLPILPVLVGNVIHDVLELILREVHARGCQSFADPRAVEVMKALGGYTKLVEGTIEQQLERLEGNPRVAGRIDELRATLLTRGREMRQRVQAVISRTTLMPGDVSESRTGGLGERGPLGEGSHPEVELRADELRFVGRADLITIDDQGCSLTDYKTGARHDHHIEQLRTYALLWTRDREVNPQQLPLRRMVLSYAAHDEACDPPTDSELEAAEVELRDRIAEAESNLAARPPPARPAAEVCRHCAVRHLCDDYWASPDAGATPTGSSSGDFVDREVTVRSRNGPRSWMVALEPDPEPALLRTATEAPGFSSSDRVRILGLLFGRDEESGNATLTMTQSSEPFVLGSEAQ